MDKTGPARGWLPNFLRKSEQKFPSTDVSPDERSSLLPKSDGNRNRGSPTTEEEGEIYPLDEADGPTLRKVLTEFKVLAKGSIPVILAYTLQNSLQTISVVIVGRGSPEDLATASFAYMFAMATAWLIALGGTTALDTLCSSSFTGSKDRHDLGVLLQRAFIILGLLYIPVAILWIVSEPLFVALGEDAQLSRDSRRFLCCLIPGGLGYIYFEAMKKYLQAQGELIGIVTCKSYIGLMILRDHETRNIRPAHHLTDQRRSQFPLHLYLEDWLAGSTNRHRHLVLAFIPPSGGLRTLLPGL